MNNLDLKKFVLPAVFILIAVYLMIVSFGSYGAMLDIDPENANYGLVSVVAAIMVLLMAGVQLLFSLGILTKLLIKPAISLAIIAVLSLVSLAFVFGNYKSYERRQTEIDTFYARKKAVISNLEDLSEIQKLHKKEKGQYASSMEEIVSFMENYKVAEIKKTGEAIPAELDTASEATLLAMGLIHFDTTYINVMEKYFTSEEAKLERLEQNKEPFSVDRLNNLKIVPETKSKDGEILYFIFRTDSVKDEMIDKMMVTFEVVDPRPNGEVKDDSLRIGDLYKTSANGNWTND